MTSLIDQIHDHIKETYNTLSEGVVGDRLREDAQQLSQNVSNALPFLNKDPRQVGVEDFADVMPMGVTIAKGSKLFPEVNRNLLDELDAKLFKKAVHEGDPEAYQTYWDLARVQPTYDAKMNPTHLSYTPAEMFDEMLTSKYKPIRDVVNDPDGAILKNYPELSTKVVARYTDQLPEGVHGQFYPGSNKIDVSVDATDPATTLLHEIDHAIQEHVGLTGGASPGMYARFGDFYNEAPDVVENIFPDLAEKYRSIYSKVMSDDSIHSLDVAPIANTASYKHTPGEVNSNISELMHMRPYDEATAPINLWAEFETASRGIKLDPADIIYTPDTRSRVVGSMAENINKIKANTQSYYYLKGIVDKYGRPDDEVGVLTYLSRLMDKARADKDSEAVQKINEYLDIILEN